MSAVGGTARTHLQCGAHSSISPNSNALCNNHVTVDMLNDGQYDNLLPPEGWHVVLGTSVDKTVVRCPSHCTWVPSRPWGHWEDAE